MIFFGLQTYVRPFPIPSVSPFSVQISTFSFNNSYFKLRNIQPLKNSDLTVKDSLTSDARFQTLKN